MIAGILLAAGKSTRIGQPKALLAAFPGGPTFLERILDSLRGGGVDRIVVVLGGSADAIEAAVPAQHGVSFVRNPDYERGQLSSLRAGLDAMDEPDVEAVLVTLIDMPLVSAASVRAVIAAARRSPRPPIVRATHRGEHGHPVLFAREVFDELKRADPEVGARKVVRAHASDLVNVELSDPGVVIDIDTWEDYGRFIGPRPSDD